MWKESRFKLVPCTEFVGGSFLEAASIPTSKPGIRDIYILRVVLHDWNDAKTLEILVNIRSAIGCPLSSPCILFCAARSSFIPLYFTPWCRNEYTLDIG